MVEGQILFGPEEPFMMGLSSTTNSIDLFGLVREGLRGWAG